MFRFVTSPSISKLFSPNKIFPCTVRDRETRHFWGEFEGLDDLTALHDLEDLRSSDRGHPVELTQNDDLV